MNQKCGCDNKSGRYLSFIGIDCMGNASRVMDCIERHRAIPGHNNAFWDYFAAKRAGAGGPRPDDLLLIHSNLGQIRELFEAWDDQPALALLQQLEVECC
jgi:hypothetical protein